MTDKVVPPFLAGISLSNAAARGRNGWFVAVTAEAWLNRYGLNEKLAPRAEVVVNIYAKRRGESPPIILALSREDAKALAWFLIGRADDLPLYVEEDERFDRKEPA